MDKDKLKLLNDVNRAIIKFRGIYSKWAAEQGISYHELLVFYTIREHGYCTQKEICENYLLPKQTINNVISYLCREGILRQDKRLCSGRVKAFVLTEHGSEYAERLLNSLNDVENRALDMMGTEKLQTLIELLFEYDRALTAESDGTR